ncbi:DUF2637 domain-containing protein [Streptomyces hydrogenans]|uniref:DUF2637 domain-containing protein n=1 Tax=Streptomyces hydrogenans TaxID=1873719 RepID=UPI00380536CF
MPALYAVAALAGLLVGVIGFAASYSTLEAAALDWGFGPSLAAAFPIGVDASIVAFLALDLVLIHRRTPWPLLRLSAHVMTAVTIVLNASAHGGLTLSSRTLSHAVMPVLFVIGVEAGRRLVVRAARLADGHDTEGVPAYRWALAPATTWRIWRRMKLWRIKSYVEAVRMEKARTIYRMRLEQRYGKGWKSAAKPDELLPLAMAAYGLSVDEALLIPEQERAAQAERDRLTKEREAQTAAEEQARQVEAKKAKAAARIAALDADTSVAEAEAAAQARAAAAQVAAGASVAVAEATADAQADAARRAAAAEAAAAEAAAVAAAEATARQQAATEEQAAADAARAAADAQRDAADARRAADDAEAAADDARARKAARLADAERQEQAAADAARAAADARRAAADAERDAADARRAAADAETAALDAEALTKLSQTERAARFVARIILRDYEGDAERMTVEAVAAVLDVAHGTASKRRAEAAELIAGGYTG